MTPYGRLITRRRLLAALVTLSLFPGDPVYKYLVDFKGQLRESEVERIINRVDGVRYQLGATDSQRRRWRIAVTTRRSRHRVLDDLKDLPEVSRAGLID